MHRSREGRHTAKASTWMLRHHLVENREQAVKLVQRGKVKIRGSLAETIVSYVHVKRDEIEVM